MKELVIVLAPRTHELRPDVNAQEYSNGLTQDKVKTLKWDENQVTFKKLKLEVDELFLLAGNVYGKFDTNHSNVLTERKNNTYVTFTCPQKPINTEIWKCANGEIIESSNICDSFSDCKDKSDEDPLMCKMEMEFIWHVMVSILVIGLVVNLVTSMFRYHEERKAMKNSKKQFGSY